MADPTQPAPQSGQPQQQPQQPPAAQAPREHIAAPGETVEMIAKKYGVKPYDLRYANQLWNRTLKLGEKLKIPPPRAPKSTATKAPTPPSK